MAGDIFSNAIREQSSDSISGIMSGITPDILGDSIPSLVGRLDEGESSKVLAEETLDGILGVVETEVLGDAVDVVFNNFGQRIFDMLVTGPMMGIFERVTLMFTGN